MVIPAAGADWTQVISSTDGADQQADFTGPLWGQVGPEVDGRWSWVVFDFDADNAEVAAGIAATEDDAKRAAEHAADF